MKNLIKLSSYQILIVFALSILSLTFNNSLNAQTCRETFQNIDLYGPLLKIQRYVSPMPANQSHWLPKQRLIKQSLPLVYRFLRDKMKNIDPFEVFYQMFRVVEVDVSSIEFPFYKDNGQFAGDIKYYRGRSKSSKTDKGGVRENPDVDIFEVMDLTIGMNLKTSLFNLPFSGGKSGILLPKGLTAKEKTRAYREILQRYIAKYPHQFNPEFSSWAPDVNTNSKVMKIFLDEYFRQLLLSGEFAERYLSVYEHMNPEFMRGGHRLDYTGETTPVLNEIIRVAKEQGFPLKELAVVTGKDPDFGGHPIREQATGLGVVVSGLRLAKVLLPKKVEDKSLTFAVQGFGNVGFHSAKEASLQGYKVSVVTEYKPSTGEFIVLKNLNGIEVNRLKDYLNKGYEIDLYHEEGLQIQSYRSESDAIKDLFNSPVDIFVTAAFGEKLTTQTAQYIPNDGKTRIFVEGGNGPTASNVNVTNLARNKHFYIMPDIIGNGLGVYGSYREYRLNFQQAPGTAIDSQKERQLMIEKMEQVVDENLLLWQQIGVNNVSLREVAIANAVAKIIEEPITEARMESFYGN